MAVIAAALLFVYSQPATLVDTQGGSHMAYLGNDIVAACGGGISATVIGDTVTLVSTYSVDETPQATYGGGWYMDVSLSYKEYRNGTMYVNHPPISLLTTTHNGIPITTTTNPTTLEVPLSEGAEIKFVGVVSVLVDTYPRTGYNTLRTYSLTQCTLTPEETPTQEPEEPAEGANYTAPSGGGYTAPTEPETTGDPAPEPSETEGDNLLAAIALGVAILSGLVAANVIKLGIKPTFAAIIAILAAAVAYFAYTGGI